MNDEIQISYILDQHTNLLEVESDSEIEKSIRKKYFILNRVLDGFPWDRLSNEEKHQKRKAALMILKKWDCEDGHL